MGMGLRGTGHRMVDRAWSVADVAYFLGVCDAMVRKLERDGKLPSLLRFGSRITFDPKIVRALREGTLNVLELSRRERRRRWRQALRRTCPDQNETSRSQGAGERRSSSDERSFSQPMAVPASYLVAALHGGWAHLWAPGRTAERCGSVAMHPRKVGPNQLVCRQHGSGASPSWAARRDQYTCALCLVQEQPSV
jgi:hypothetical protein